MAATTRRSEERARERKGLAGGRFSSSSSWPSGRPCPQSRAPREGFRRFPRLRPRRGLLPRGVGLVRSGRRPRSLQHRARRGAPLPGPTAATNGGRFGRWDWVANGALFAVTTCTSRGSFRQPWSRASSLRPIPRGGSRARGWGSSCTRCRPPLHRHDPGARLDVTLGACASREFRQRRSRHARSLLVVLTDSAD